MIEDDTAHMRAALSLAQRGLGTTWPNPAVGCVIVRNGTPVGRGWTAPGGRPHAEALALARAGAHAQGATAYVTLEPCSHHGRTPPCADALIEAGIARVVIACPDPDPRVAGAGAARLRAAGIELRENLLRDEAETLLRGYLSRQTSARPLVTLKLASTLDGRIALASGESRWLTGPAARREVHALRARHDAILLGIGAVLTDDPLLTVRLPGATPRPPIRIVADSHLRLPLASRLAGSTSQAPLWILHREDEDESRRAPLIGIGARLFPVPGSEAGIGLRHALTLLAGEGITSLLCEGGAGLAASLLRARLVDRIAWFHAPGIAGADAWPATEALNLDSLDDLPRFRRFRARTLGPDLMTLFDSLPT
jgi:diaminohydroxyphosphoribosylaminopyrimidine deaminase / 5-amino-6-(5-phosphoribosylamino)uracil reductase